MSNTPETSYVQIGRIVYGPCASYAEAMRLSNGEAGGTVVDHVAEGCTQVSIDKLAAIPTPAEPVDDGVLPPIEELSDDWDVLQMAGLHASEGQERRRWYLGDLAAKVERRYGQRSIAKFAGDVKIPKSKTLLDYWRVSKFYQLSARAAFPALTWSHYREAMKARDFEGAMDWLSKAEDYQWPVVKLGQEIDKARGKTVHVRHAFDVVCITKGQGKVLVSMSFDQCDEFIRRFEEGRANEDFNLSLAVSWLEHEEPAA